MVQLLHPYMTVGKTIALTIQNYVGKVMSLLFNKMSKFVIAFLPRSKCLLISWLQPSFAAIFSSFNSVAQSCLTFVTPWATACQAFLSITNSQSLLKLMPIKWVMTSNHLIPCHPLLLLPAIPPSIRVFSSESTHHMRWPEYWEFQLQHQSFIRQM